MGALKNLSNIFKYGFYLLALGIVFATGLFTGRKTVKIPEPIEKTEYITSDPIHDTLWMDKPYFVKKPADTLGIIEACIRDGIYKDLWPEKLVTEYITKDDTTAILSDWATERRYKETLFDSDSLGRCSVDATVKYNRLNSLEYEYIPVNKVTTNTIYTAKYFAPFAGAGVMINPWDKEPDMIVEVNGGVFMSDKYGIQMKYQRGFKSNNDYFGASLLYKF